MLDSFYLSFEKFSDSYTTSWCNRQVEPIRPHIECRYGYVRNICNKTTCLRGPDEECVDDMIPTGGHCASGLRCCGICIGCYNEIDCSQQHCDLPASMNTLRSKKTLVRPLWFLNFYQHQEDQGHTSDMIEQQQQNQRDQEQQEIQQKIQQILPDRYSVSYKPFTYTRPKNYPLNSLEYIITPEY